ncbi:unnamed protein product [Ilex paraguariensis]|uniref:Uncharacterized protein n=1 Tax=Ilex paraguariensis TaxID=185542 RepID=A0ABC8RKH9_9AQUA
MEAAALPCSVRHSWWSLVGMLRIDSGGMRDENGVDVTPLLSCYSYKQLYDTSSLELPPNSTAFGINLNPNTDDMEKEDCTEDNFGGGEGKGDNPNKVHTWPT